MKKAWVFLIALALLAFSMPIFADAPAAGSFHAWNQGNLFPYYQFGSATATWGWGPLWDTAPGIDQEWTFSYDGNNYGFNATFEFGMDQFVTGPTAAGQPISWFATYYKFGDLVKVTIGKPRFNDYTEFSQIEGNNYRRFGDSDWMAIAQVFPIPGLSIAGAFYVPPQAAALSVGTSPNYGNNFGIAASFAIPNLLTIKAMYRTDEQSKINGLQATYNNPNKVVGVAASVGAMQGLTINAALQANISLSNMTIIQAFVSAKTGMFAPLSLAVDAAVTNVSGSAVTGNTAYMIELNGEFTFLAPWSVGATVGYDGGSATGVVTGWFNQGVGDWTGLEVWPYIKASFDNGSSFKVGVVYGSAGPGGATGAVIAVPIIYVWAF